MAKGLQGIQGLCLLTLDTQATLCALSKVLSEWSVQLEREKAVKVQAHRSAHTHTLPPQTAQPGVKKSKALAWLCLSITCHYWMMKSIDMDKQHRNRLLTQTEASHGKE